MSKNVLITGSAKGIGKAIALEFAKNGYTVAINTKNSVDKMNETLEELRKYSPSSIAVCEDVSSYDGANRLIDIVQSKIGAVDVLVNNAGVSYIGLFNEMKPAQWQSLMKNNVDSMLNCTHLVLPSMIHNHRGCIINISSMWGIAGASCEAIYSASKGAVNSFTKALAKELAPSGIYVNAIACGAIDTEMNSFLSEEERAALEDEIPMGRFGQTSEVASLALYLANESSYITGQIISLDGGMM
jgi:3-oxoacyl-[acyl-carrier protein] reductase